MPDPYFEGGGLHEIKRGGMLAIHYLVGMDTFESRKNRVRIRYPYISLSIL